MKTIPAAPRSYLPIDVYPDHVEFNNLDGNRRRIERVTYEADANAAKIVYNGGRSFIRLHADHPAYASVAVAAGFDYGMGGADDLANLETRCVMGSCHCLRDDAKYLVVIPCDKKRRKDAEHSAKVINTSIDNLVTYMRFAKRVPERLADGAASLREAADAMNAAKICPTAAKRFAKVAAWLESQRPAAISAAEPDPVAWDAFVAMIPDPAPIPWDEFAALIAA